MSESPQFNVYWRTEQFKLAYAEVVSQVTVCMGLNNPKSWKSMGIDLRNIFSDRPALAPYINSFVEAFVQNYPLVHIVGGLKLPSLHSPHHRVAEWICLWNDSATLQRNTDKLLRFVVCDTWLTFVMICDDITRSSRIQWATERFDKLKTWWILVSLCVARSSEEVENSLILSVWKEFFWHSIKNRAHKGLKCSLLDWCVWVLSNYIILFTTSDLVCRWLGTEIRCFTLSNWILIKTFLTVVQP